MSLLIKKTLWPAAIIAGFLVFMGAVGVSVKPAYAQPEIIDICGPASIAEDETRVYVAFVDTDDGFPEFLVGINNEDGDSDITSAVVDADDYEELDDPTDLIDDLDPLFLDDSDFDDIIDDVEAADPEFDLDDCIAATLDDIEDIIEDLDDDIKDKIDAGGNIVGFGDFDIDCPDATPTDPPFCSISSEIIDAVVEALAEAMVDDLIFDCDDLSDIAEDAALNAGATEIIGAQFNDAIGDQCEAGDLPGLDFDAIVIVDVTCNDAGTFDLSFTADDDGEASSALIEVECFGEVDEIRLTVTPAVVETVPALGSVEFSLVVARLLDSDDNPAGGGIVDFTTDKCAFLDEDGLTEAQFLVAVGLFDQAATIKSPGAVADLYAFLATITPDRDDESNPVASFQLDANINNASGTRIWRADDTLAAIILDCSADNIAPGTATVTAEVDQEGADVIASAKVTVVGPPATVSAAASVASVTCGDTATIVVTVKDAAGQNVSDHTRVEAVTNFGGVLGGTGSTLVGSLGGVVNPISSTVAETFSGVATFTLITSDTHVGNYNLVIATGGGGSITGGLLGGQFSTPVVTANVTVACAQPVVAPAATVTAPRTGTGITPPNTGDAGLANASGAGLSLFVIAGVAAFALAGVASLKFARR